MKKYDILSKDDFSNFTNKIVNHISRERVKGNNFPSMSIIVKRFRKDKTPKQHRYYWVVVSQLSKAFKNVGYDYNKEVVHEFLKRAYGYTQEITITGGKTVHVTKSIADDSDEVNIEVMMELIDFAIRFASENLDWVIEDPRKAGE